MGSPDSSGFLPVLSWITSICPFRFDWYSSRIPGGVVEEGKVQGRLLQVVQRSWLAVTQCVDEDCPPALVESVARWLESVYVHGCREGRCTRGPCSAQFVSHVEGVEVVGMLVAHLQRRHLRLHLHPQGYSQTCRLRTRVLRLCGPTC